MVNSVLNMSTPLVIAVKKNTSSYHCFGDKDCSSYAGQDKSKMVVGHKNNEERGKQGKPGTF